MGCICRLKEATAPDRANSMVGVINGPKISLNKGLVRLKSNDTPAQLVEMRNRSKRRFFLLKSLNGLNLAVVNLSRKLRQSVRKKIFKAFVRSGLKAFPFFSNAFSSLLCSSMICFTPLLIYL